MGNQDGDTHLQVQQAPEQAAFMAMNYHSN